MRDVFLVAAAFAQAEGDEPLVDANRVRRMDLFGRAGFHVGVRAFDASGRARGSVPDPGRGIVVGTCHGCRPAIFEHAARLGAASRLEDLAPSVFAATVHNTVNGELAIELSCGGISETIVSGRTSGLEALILGARRVASGDADEILVVAAEGLDAATRAAWEEEKAAFGERASGVELAEAAAAVLLVADDDNPGGRLGVRYVAGTLFFEPDARRAEARVLEWIGEIAARACGRSASPTVIPCGPLYEAFLEGDRGKERSAEPRIERFGAAGVYEIARAVAFRSAPAPPEPDPSSPSRQIFLAYVTRDITGAVAAVIMEFP